MAKSLQRYFLSVYDPLVSVPSRFSWLWLTCNWVFDYWFTYWVWWCVCDPLGILEIKCYFSVLWFIVFRVEHLQWGGSQDIHGFWKLNYMATLVSVQVYYLIVKVCVDGYNFYSYTLWAVLYLYATATCDSSEKCFWTWE